MLDADGVTCLGTRGPAGVGGGEQTPAGGHSVRWGSEMKGAKRALGDATEVEGWTLLVAQWLRLCDPRTRAWVPSLVEELRAGTLCGTAKKKKVEGWNE